MRNFNILLFVLSSIILSSQTSIIWQKTYGGSDAEYLRGGVLPTKSGGYIIAGDSNSPKNGNKTVTNIGVWLIGTDNVGNILWEKGYCEVSGSLLDFKRTSDENYILCINSSADTCEYKSRKSSSSDIWVIKINETGDVIWEKTISGMDAENSPVLITTQDHGFLIGAESKSSVGLDKTDFLYGVSDYWIIKLDSLGNIEWDKTIGGSKQDGVKGLAETSDGYIVGGFSLSGVSGFKTIPTYGSSDYWVFKLNKQGKTRWQRAFGGNSIDFLYSVYALKDNSVILCGYSASDTSGNKSTLNFGKDDWWIVKLDSLGNQVWQKSYGGDGTEGSNPIRIISSGESDFYLYGTSSSGISGNKTTPSRGGSDFWILKLDSVGNILHQYSFGGDGYDILRNLYQETDSTFILSGESSSTISGDKSETGYGSQDWWVLKVNLNQTITATNSKEVSKVNIYPNPTKDIINIVSDSEIEHALIINLYGQPSLYNINSNKSIDISKLIPGAYYIRLVDKNGNFIHGEMIYKF